jgi:cell division protein FtsI (penicillin-binding protein 3)
MSPLDFINKRKKDSAAHRTRRGHIRARYLLISTFILLIAGMCVLFLLNTTIIHAHEWNEKGDSTLIDTILIKPLRGDILASDGSILATNLRYYNIRIDFHASRINELKYKESLDSLADTLALYYPERTRDEWYEKLYHPLTIPKKDRSRSFLLLRNIPFEEVQRVKQFPYFRRSPNPNRTGFKSEPVLLRRYPYGEMARLSIGRVGQTATSEEVHGISGLEQALDTLLYGTPGRAKKVLFTRGTAYWRIDEPQNGSTLTTTIDITIQDILEHELGEMLVECKAEWGSAMIMEVATGDIKAISNLDRDTVGNNGYIEAMNHIVQAYEPGSVIKVVSMLTALEDGYVNLNQVYPIGRSYAYAGGKPIRDTHSPAFLPVSRFMEYSSNIGMTKLIAPHYDKNLNGFRERLRQIGFFDRLNTGMARERPPYYPTLDPKSGGHVSLSRMIFGYATQVPPLYTCAIYNAIANDGKFVRPRLVKAMKLANGRDSVIPVSYVRDSICSPRNAAILREMMHSVVWGEGGTAKGLRNDIVEIAGKTGTAGIALERPRDKNGNLILTHIPFKGGYREGKHNRVAFCGFFPYDNPKYTCIVVISDPQGPYGPAATSGTVLRNLALKMYARGMLGNDSDFKANPVSSSPTLYGSHNKQRSSTLHNDLNLNKFKVIRTANGPAKPATVPNVIGLGIREALVSLEEAGLLVNFSGTGYVTQISPPAGTAVAPGTRVKVTLSQN